MSLWRVKKQPSSSAYDKGFIFILLCINIEILSVDGWGQIIVMPKVYNPLPNW